MYNSILFVYKILKDVMGFNGIKKVIFEQHCKHYKGNDGLVTNCSELYWEKREGAKHFMTFCDWPKYGQKKRHHDIRN